MTDVRKKFAVACAILGVVALVAMPAMAQDTTTPVQAPHANHQAMMLSKLTTKLSLTEEQQTAAKALYADLQAKMAPIHTASKALRTQLHAAFQAATPDAATVGNVVIQQHENRTQMKAVMSDFHTKFQALLTPDQLSTFNAMHAKRASFRGHFGAGQTATQ
jgi:Spy/CpxP family protein refolding chaperone